MDQKRKLVHGDGRGCLDPEAKRQRTLLNSLREVIVMRHSVEQHLPKIEHFLRRVVQEEVQYAFWRRLDVDPRVNRLQSSKRKPYQIRFLNSLPKTIFTNKKIEAEGQKPVQIAIVDSSSQIVTSGHFSSVKVEIVVLDGDFSADGQDEWIQKGFTDNIVREREGKRPLLTGEMGVTLSKGIGYVGDVNFTDNSSWIRSRKFRLGARVCGENDIREAVSEAFLVKDHRGESYQKHHPPLLADDVWRLEKIGKDGVFHKRLEDNKIKTVQDFLRNLVMDQQGLRNLLGNGMSNKMWDAIVEHAWECRVPKDLYTSDAIGGLLASSEVDPGLVGLVHQSHDTSTSHPYPVEDLFSAQPLDEIQHIDSFQISSFNSNNAEIIGLVEPARLNDPLTELNGDAGMVCQSPFSSMLWGSTDLRDDLYQLTGAVTSRKPAHGCAKSSAKWVKLMAVSKWMGVARRSAARKASARDACFITMFPSMRDVYAGDDLWS